MVCVVALIFSCIALVGTIVESVRMRRIWRYPKLYCRTCDQFIWSYDAGNYHTQKAHSVAVIPSSEKEEEEA